MQNNFLKNKKIILSAGASGIGLATVKLLLSRGAFVYTCDIDKKNINKLKKNPYFNKKLFISECEASKENEVKKFYKEVSNKTKKIDGLINNIGIAGPTSPLEKIKSEDWEKTLQVNVNSHFYFTKYAIPMIKKSKHGSIVNISSTAGIDGFPNRSPYAASKWALVGITKTLAMELGKFNIRVNAICPGSVKGARMMRVIKAKAKMLNQSVRSIEKDFVSMSSLKQWVYEDDIAKMCSFLISQDSLRVSGQVISIDGNTERMD